MSSFKPNFTNRRANVGGPNPSRGPASQASQLNRTLNSNWRSQAASNADAASQAITQGMSSLALNNNSPYSRVASTQAQSLHAIAANAPYTAQDFKVGDLVWVPHIVPSLDPNPANSNHKVATATVGHVTPKSRPAIVVRIYKNRMTVLVMYSCGKHGVLHKPEIYKATALSVCSKYEKDPENPDMLTQERLWMKGTTKPYPGSHINLNEPFSVDYRWNIQRTSDRLDEASIARLTEWFFLANHRMADKAVDSQHPWLRQEMNESKRKAFSIVPGSVTSSAATSNASTVKAGSYASAAMSNTSRRK